MAADNPRVQELRRRVQLDPASIAFAQLAEECRRSGDNDDAVAIARAGLVHHPDYLLARVTLGRALVELGQLEEAQRELALVLARAPENLPAIRAMAEVHQQCGEMKDALEYYRRALKLAQFDPELESAVERIEHVVAPQPTPAQPAAPAKVEDLFDFDTLLEQLGGRPSGGSGVPMVPEVPLVPGVLMVPELPMVPSAVESVQLQPDASDPFSRLEQQLRESEQQAAAQRAAEAQRAEDERRAQESARVERHEQDQLIVVELEQWLAAIEADRSHPAA